MKKYNFNFRYNHKITIFSLSTAFFLYLLYLSIPSLYDTGRVQKVFNEKFLTDFNLNISLSTDISYRILPQPHFLIKDAKLFYDKLTVPHEISNIIPQFIKDRYSDWDGELGRFIYNQDTSLESIHQKVEGICM